MDGLIERFAELKSASLVAPGRRPHIVIVGAGFGGLTAAMRLKARTPM
jgi:cation diffusion facilitator CzcD-associated flavoprotein CzcO